MFIVNSYTDLITIVLCNVAANYIAFVGGNENSVVLFDINTGELLMNLVRFNSQLFPSENSDENSQNVEFHIRRLRIFKPGMYKLNIIIQGEGVGS